MNTSQGLPITTFSHIPFYFNFSQPTIYYPNFLTNQVLIPSQQVNFIPQNFYFSQRNVNKHNINYQQIQNREQNLIQNRQQIIESQRILRQPFFKDQNQSNSKNSSSSYRRHKTIHKNVTHNHRKYQQNMRRNAMTNIGNQVITFLGSRKRSQHIYIRFNKNHSEQQIVNFYKFIHNLRRRKRVPVYINQEKLLDIWYSNKQSAEKSENYKTLRQISHFYLLNILPQTLLNSTRIQKQIKIFHISAARTILKLLRYRNINC